MILFSILAKLTELGYGKEVQSLKETSGRNGYTLNSIKTINFGRKLTNGGQKLSVISCYRPEK
jgi:hypothetical protein